MPVRHAPALTLFLAFASLVFVQQPILAQVGAGNLTLNIDNVSVQNGGSNQTGANVTPGTALSGSVSVNGVTNNGGATSVTCSDSVAGQLYSHSFTSNGYGTFSFTPAAGQHSATCTAQYSGTHVNGTATTGIAYIPVVPATQTAISLNPTSSAYGTSVQAQINVTSTSGVPTGTVTCSMSAGAQLGSGTLSNGSVALVLSTLPVGSDTISCSYPGDSIHAASSGSATESVTSSPTTISLTSSNQNAGYGALVVFTASVTSADGTTPSGIVTFFEGSTPLGAGVLVNGIAAASRSNLLPGSHTINATYSGDQLHLLSSAFLSSSQVIQPGPPATSITFPLNRVIAGYPIQVLVSVTNSPGFTPQGTVTCSAPGASSVSGNLDSTATAKMSFASLPLGVNNVTCNFVSSTNSDSSSSTQPLAVLPSGPSSTGGLGVNRAYHIAASLPGNKVLIAGGQTVSGGHLSSLSSAEIYSLDTGISITAAPMNSAHYSSASATLLNGNVMIAGGLGSSASAVAEYYDLSTGTFKLTGPMASTRYEETATTLRDGTVLLIGGNNVYNYGVPYAELYEPLTNSWVQTGSLSQPRYGHTATKLTSGKVLAAGGIENAAFASTEIYDPVSKTFSAGPSMAAARVAHTATLLADGTVLITGGYAGYANPPLSSAELYDPNTNTFSLVGSMATARYSHAATLLPNGQVLISGGWSGSGQAISALEVYDPVSKAFSAAGSLAVGRSGHSAVAVGQTTVLISGGDTTGNNFTTTNELFDSQPAEEGFLDPKFLVIGVIYAPPGSASKVTYGAGTTIGMTTTLDYDKKSTTKVQVQEKAASGIQIGSFNLFSGSGTLTGSSEWDSDVDSSSSYTVQSSLSGSDSVPGPASSAIGVDHDYDYVYVWLDPQVGLSFPSNPQPTVNWVGYAYKGCDATHTTNCDGNSFGNPDILRVPVLCLKNPYLAPFCTQFKPFFDRSWDTSGVGGLTLDDLATIASADPFVSDPNYNPTNDPKYRFLVANGVVPFQLPPPNGQPITSTGSVSITQTAADSQTVGDTYTEAYSFDTTITGGFLATFAQDFLNSGSTSWTQKTTVATSHMLNAMANYSITGPTTSDAYTGPIQFNAYHDNLYGTFMFYSTNRPSVPIVTITPSVSAVSFPGSTPQGSTSAFQTLTFTNTNSQAISLAMGTAAGSNTAASVAVTFSSASFSIVSGAGHDTCTGRVLPAQASCTVDVQFSPVATDLPNVGSNVVNGAIILSGIELAPQSTFVMRTSVVALSATGTR